MLWSIFFLEKWLNLERKSTLLAGWSDKTPEKILKSGILKASGLTWLGRFCNSNWFNKSLKITSFVLQWLIMKNGSLEYVYKNYVRLNKHLLALLLLVSWLLVLVSQKWWTCGWSRLAMGPVDVASWIHAASLEPPSQKCKEFFLSWILSPCLIVRSFFRSCKEKPVDGKLRCEAHRFTMVLRGLNQKQLSSGLVDERLEDPHVHTKLRLLMDMKTEEQFLDVIGSLSFYMFLHSWRSTIHVATLALL